MRGPVREYQLEPGINPGVGPGTDGDVRWGRGDRDNPADAGIKRNDEYSNKEDIRGTFR